MRLYLLAISILLFANSLVAINETDAEYTYPNSYIKPNQGHSKEVETRHLQKSLMWAINLFSSPIFKRFSYYNHNLDFLNEITLDCESDKKLKKYLENKDFKCETQQNILQLTKEIYINKIHNQTVTSYSLGLTKSLAKLLQKRYENRWLPTFVTEKVSPPSIAAYSYIKQRSKRTKVDIDTDIMFYYLKIGDHCKGKTSSRPEMWLCEAIHDAYAQVYAEELRKNNNIY